VVAGTAETPSTLTIMRTARALHPRSFSPIAIADKIDRLLRHRQATTGPLRMVAKVGEGLLRNRLAVALARRLHRIQGRAYLVAMNRRPRPLPLPLRGVAMVLGLTLASSSGVPMCASVIARAGADCPMHSERGTPSQAIHGTAVVAAPAAHDACHDGANDMGCLAGELCPTGGVSARTASGAGVGLGAPARAREMTVGSDHPSFLSPPLPPPPRA
jgi:hypothetical protein